MPSQTNSDQFLGGESFVTGEMCTATRLNDHVKHARLTAGSITSQIAMWPSDVAPEDCINIWDASSDTLKQTEVQSLLTSGGPIITDLITKKDGPIVIVGNTRHTGTVTVSETLDVDGTSNFGNVIIHQDLSVEGYGSFTGSGALKIPVGTTGQRPYAPVIGMLRYNTTTTHTEVYNGASWEVTGGGNPFDASGGNFIIAPDPAGTTPITATFVSGDGSNVVVTKAGHTIYPGQVIEVTSSVAGYAGKWTVISTTTNTFTYLMYVNAAPNSGSLGYVKSGNYKCHIFTTDGSFVAGSISGRVQVLVVGGGGGGSNWGGGGGAVCHVQAYSLAAGSTTYVTIGQGGTPIGGGGQAGNGTASVFGTITSGGGLGGGQGGYQAGGASGIGSYNCPSNLGFMYAGGGAGESPQAVAGDGLYSAGVGVSSYITGIKTEYGGGGVRGPGGYASGWGNSTGRCMGGGYSGIDALPNSGGGGGGLSGSNGGSGIVIISYQYSI